MAHLMISAAHKSSGKTTLSIGLCAALSAKGYRIQPYKKGPDYIDPLWLSAAAGQPCYNLDFYTMTRDEISEVFARYMQSADIGLIEGNKGLYDGLDLDGSNSNAALAIQLRAPVVLVLDTRGMTRGVAPLIQGYQGFDPDINIAGVILNSVGGGRHESKLRSVIEHYTDVKVLGAVAKNPELEIVERHLGLMPSNETDLAGSHIRKMGEIIGSQVDLDAVMALAQTAPVPEFAGISDLSENIHKDVRIGFARDAAFGFYYPGDMEAFEHAGAEMVPFDTLNDSRLPEVDGVFIGGGFPETRMEQLSANSGMLASIRDFIESGGPVYAECGGLMYLCRSLTWGENQCKMVGVIPADVVMHDKPQGRGYVRLAETGYHPWPRTGEETLSVAAHEFHYSGLENISPELVYAFDVQRGYGIDGQHDGIVYKNLLASYVHLRDVGGTNWTRRFVAHVRQCRSADSRQLPA